MDDAPIEIVPADLRWPALFAPKSRWPDKGRRSSWHGAG
jgi:hypothetical protein